MRCIVLSASEYTYRMILVMVYIYNSHFLLRHSGCGDIHGKVAKKTKLQKSDFIKTAQSFEPDSNSGGPPWDPGWGNDALLRLGIEDKGV